MTIKPLELAHVDTCLSCYFSGDSRAHLQIAVWHGMKMSEIKQALIEELRQGVIGGNDELAQLLRADWVPPEKEAAAIQACKRAYAAINRMKPTVKGQRTFFKELDKQTNEDDETVYAFFVFVEKE